jgi:hypothetical protein
MYKYALLPFVLILTVVVGVGCGSIIRTSMQDLPISSNPSGAEVKIDGMSRGRTPVTVSVRRKDQHHYIEITKDGYHPYEMYMTRKTSGGYVICDMLWDLGLISYLWIDRSKGGVYEQHPDVIQSNLIPLTQAAPPPPVIPTNATEEDAEATSDS